MNRKGFTLVEMLMTAALVGVVVLMITQLGNPLTKYFQRNQARQAASTEARICLENIQRTLSNGRVSTLVIPMPSMYTSQVQFQTMDNSSYTITWSTGATNTVQLLRTANGVTNTTVLATHVTGLFFVSNTNDPALVSVSLQLTVPLDTSGTPDSFLTILMPPLTVRLIGS